MEPSKRIDGREFEGSSTFMCTVYSHVAIARLGQDAPGQSGGPGRCPGPPHSCLAIYRIRQITPVVPVE